MYARTSDTLVSNTGKITVKESYLYCKRVAHRHGPHFSLGFRFLPPRKRDAIYAVYALCRYTDDIVDERLSDASTGREAALVAWEEEIDRCYNQKPTHPITIALAHTLTQYPVPKSGFLALIEGCRMDLTINRYNTFAALLVYCDRVATSIRDLSLPIFGYSSPMALRYGLALSTALQLTNIVRDIGEDLNRGRIYLPLDEIHAAGLSEYDLIKRIKSGSFLRLIHEQCARIQNLFQEARHLIPLIDPDARLAISLMLQTYVALIDRIEASPFDVLDRPIRLSQWERAKIVTQALLPFNRAGRFG